MYNTEQCLKKSNYLVHTLILPGYIPISSLFVIKKWNFEHEYGCSDSLAREINKAFKEADDSKNHTTYNTVEEFLDSLKNR